VTTLSETTSLAASTGETPHFAMLENRIADPLDARIIANLGMIGIHHDDFVILHGGILIDPVRIQNTQVAIATTSLFFCDTLQVTFKFQLIDTLMPIEKRIEREKGVCQAMSFR
jgi:hypothetical protein